jgi:hypothetical protein
MMIGRRSLLASAIISPQILLNDRVESAVRLPVGIRDGLSKCRPGSTKLTFQRHALMTARIRLILTRMAA